MIQNRKANDASTVQETACFNKKLRLEMQYTTYYVCIRKSVVVQSTTDHLMTTMH